MSALIKPFHLIESWRVAVFTPYCPKRFLKIFTLFHLYVIPFTYSMYGGLNYDKKIYVTLLE